MKSIIIATLIILSSSSTWAELPKKILMVSAERSGIKETGGLGHATTGLQSALNQSGIHTDFIMPAYRQMNAENLRDLNFFIDVELDFQNGQAKKKSRFKLYSDQELLHPTYFLAHDSKPKETNYFDNTVNANQTNPSPYTPNAIEGEAWGAWAKATTEFILANNYDMVILNDWHSAAIALFLDMAKKQGHKVPKLIMTIHNMIFQGIYPHSLLGFLGVPESYFNTDNGLEYHGNINFLKAGLILSDGILAVSEKYAQEITTTSDFGAGLEGVLKKEMSKGKIIGMLNGIAPEEWSPQQSYHPEVKWTFSANNLTGKEKGKLYLQQSMGLNMSAKTPVFVMTSRVTEQKGFEYLIPALENILKTTQVQILITGDGASKYISQLENMNHHYPGKFRYLKFSKDLEKRLTTYGDFFINAARFEPSGLNQQFSQANGTIPIVSNTGGLSDSVQDGVNGFKFELQKFNDGTIDMAKTTEIIIQTLKKVIHIYESNHDQTIDQMRIKSMSLDNSWKTRVQQKYINILNYLMEDGPQKIQAQNLQAYVSSESMGSIEQLLQLVGLKVTPKICEQVF